jgi:hypothetical protein
MKIGTLWVARFSRRKLTYSVQFHQDQDLPELARYWADQLGIAPDEIRLQRKANSGALGSRVWRSRYGVIAVRATDTIFRARLQGWMDRLQEEWVIEARLAQLGA